jgi:phosphoribosylanthranilate isomerase
MMRRPWVKICGITRLVDAEAAIDAGTDALGFVLVPSSPRYVTPAEAARIVARLPARTAKVGVVVSQAPAAVRALVAEIGLTAIQAHGDETAQECADYGVAVVKAFGVDARFDAGALAPFRENVVLLDGVAGEAHGGTGRRADWGIAREVVERGFRVILAGGLGPENIVEAMEAVEPLGVDLNSGVERAPGIKDPDRLARALGALAHWAPPKESTWPW